MKKTVVPALVMLTLMSGCSFMPDYMRPGVETPAQFTSGAAEQPTQIAQDWWKSFGSAELDRLMDKALDGNLDLRASLQRIEQTRAALRIAGADLLPSADLNAGISRERNNPITGRTTNDTRLNAGAGVSYEIDLFGRNRAGVEGARADVRATQFDHEALKLVVMGEVARTYFALVNARERLDIADGNLKNANELMRIIEARFDAGDASKLEVSQQKSQLASTEAARASTAQAITVAENALAVLLGVAPQTLKPEGATLQGLKIPALAPGQPSTLLERRPDIRAAEQDLLSANADIAVARAAFFPSVNIGLDAGIVSAGFGDPASTAIAIASSLTAPLFQGGRLEGGVQQATARQAELAENYRKAVLVSFQEVEDALAAAKAAQQREVSLKTAADEADNAYRLSRELYNAGAADFQTVLDAQRTQLSAKDTYSQSRNERLAASVDLFLALGGGWQEVGKPVQPAQAPAAATVPAAPPPAAIPPASAQ